MKKPADKLVHKGFCMFAVPLEIQWPSAEYWNKVNEIAYQIQEFRVKLYMYDQVAKHYGYNYTHSKLV